ncbi:MAG: 2-isopropylmalate synthase [Candidatus Omnitrophica bacterium]|nr:2-isopropylmalate synthase [Candidatus Omnitrophota bacterium]
MKNDKVLIFDTTLRDGEQAPGASMNQDEKMAIAAALEKMGVDIIEAGFPVSSPGDFESVKLVAKTIKRSIVAGLARSMKKDIDAAYEALKSAKYGRIHVFLATSNIHMKFKLKKNPDEVLQMAIDAVKYAKSKMADVEFSAEDASRSDRDFLCKVVEAAIKAGAKTVNIPDTVGYTVPSLFGQLIGYIKNNVPNINKAVISVHCHDDLGLSVSNSLAAIENGARQVECTVNGIGERAGNAAMEEIVMALKTRKDIYKCETNINTKEICRVSRMVSKAAGFAVAPNKAIVGGNAFLHESGIHQHGVLADRSTYEIIKGEDVGFVGTGLVLGKHSGRHGFCERLKLLGIQLTEKQIDQAFDRFKILADKKKEVYDEDLFAIIEDEVKAVKNIWSLDSLEYKSGTKVEPSTTIALKSGGKVYKKTLTGDGPVDACYKAIDAITKVKGELLDYSIKSVSQGEDAIGEVTLKLRSKDQTVIAHGASTDIVEASAKAYINAINKILTVK